MSDYKILSLDGGGAWALIQAQALGKLYGDIPGRDILRKFNLVTATSGGSLVAGALAANMSPAAIRDIFLDETDRRKIFVDKFFAFAARFFGIGPRYKTAEKLIGIRDILAQGSKCGINGDTPLDKIANGEDGFPEFLITSFDYDRQRVAFFRSNENSPARSDSPSAEHITPTLAEALHASSNAPVNYFDEPARFNTPQYSGKRFWDGGIAGYNNPVLAGVIEAVTNKISPADIKVLSIGTGSVMLPIEDNSVSPPLAITKTSPGLIADIKKLAKAIVDDPPDAATYDAYRILHGSLKDNPPGIRVVRFNPLIQPVKNDSGQWVLPHSLSEEEFLALVKLDMDAVQQEDAELIKRFCDLWIANAVPNQPIQSGDNLSCKIGSAWFNEANAAAQNIGLAPP